MPLVIAAALIVVTIFSLTNRKAGLTAAAMITRSSGAKAAGVVCTFLLGIYGGFFSSVNVALLTSAFVAFFSLHLHRGGGID